MGQQVFSKIDSFQIEHHRLPENMDEIEPKDFSESGPMWYQKLSANHYPISFSMSLGESYTYDSETKKTKFFTPRILVSATALALFIILYVMIQPSKWSHVNVGMTLDQVLSEVGPPDALTGDINGT